MSRSERLNSKQIRELVESSDDEFVIDDEECFGDDDFSEDEDEEAICREDCASFIGKIPRNST